MKKEKALCEKAVELVAGTKDQIRGSDYRQMSIVLAKQLKRNIKDLTFFLAERQYYHIIVAADFAQL